MQVGVNEKNLRWSYISLGFIDWAIIRFLLEYQLINTLSQAIVMGLSILYIAQFDPIFQANKKRILRHYLRLLGSGIINITAITFNQNIGVIPLSSSLLTIGIGLSFKNRAFLYGGTLTFIITVLFQLFIVSLKYSFIKWLIGLGLGIILITMAAIFEKRKEKMIKVWQNWSEIFSYWQ